jgi:TatA/E family protein of Tat protein translocase
MGRIGEFLVFLSVLVVAFGWRKLPGLGGQVGKSLKAFKNGLNGKEEERPTREVQELPSKKGE